MKGSVYFLAKFFVDQSGIFYTSPTVLVCITWVFHVSGSIDMSYTQMNLPFSSNECAVSS